MTTPELKIPPFAQVLLIGAAMWVTARFVRGADVEWALRIPLASVLAVTGFALVIAAAIDFHVSGTTIDPTRPERASALRVSGVFRLSRNPMYVGMLAVLAAWALFVANWLAFLYLPFFVLYMNRFQIEPEERALFERFGADYADYTQAVRRWL